MSTSAANLLKTFAEQFSRSDLTAYLSEGLIGEGVRIPGINGPQTLIYADYVASGRALQPVEDFVLNEVLPYYANSHTEASFCGQCMTQLRQSSRQTIAQLCGADSRHAVVFTGSGATAGLNRLVHLFGVNQLQANQQAPLVLIGPYEHHSNILPWRESGAQVVELQEAAQGGPDLAQLGELLKANAGRLIVGSFSAASNVTGIKTDVTAVTKLLKSHGALSVWDYAGGAPYMNINMAAGTAAEIDAVVVSPHKFIGGPGASGVMIVRTAAVTATTPTIPGGGTVTFVSPWNHHYSKSIVAREEAGTPNVVGDIRAALCFIVKAAIGQDHLDRRLEQLRQRALAVWSNNPNLTLLGNPNAHDRLPIFSFQIHDRGVPIHQQLITRMLSDVYGIQARGGCACAGPYAHRLLDIDHASSDELKEAILQGEEMQKPGWTRLTFSVLMSDAKADRIIEAVDQLANNPGQYNDAYQVDELTARFSLAS
jgi:selenocysteine lyase/cysteine desulfurase